MADTPTIPVEYNLISRRVTCFNCGGVSIESTFMAVSFIRSRHGSGTVRHSVKCDGAQYNIPVKRLNAPSISTPFCTACPHTIDLSHLPPPPNESALTDLPEPALKSKPTVPARPTAAAKPQRRPSIFDLA